jgi:DNA-binding MarR family transcriptional regulator
MVTKMSNTTRLVDKLLIKGYVDRSICEENRRKIEIIITSKGLDILKDMDEVMHKTELMLVEQFSEQELLELNTLLNKF